MSPLEKIWIRKNLVLGVFILCSVISAFFLSLIPPVYTAINIVNFVPQTQNINDVKNTSDLKSLGTYIENEKKMIASDTVLKEVISTLDLAHLGEINPEFDPHQSKLYQFRKYLAKLQNAPFPDYGDQKSTLNYLNKNLSFTTSDGTYIHIIFKSTSPYLSRAIVNATSDAYLKIPSSNGTKTLISKTKELPPYEVIPEFYTYFCYAFITSFLISILMGITTPLPQNRETRHDHGN